MARTEKLRQRRPAGAAAPARGGVPLATRLGLISQVTDRLVRSVDFEETLRILIEGATDLLGVDRGSILILDPDSRTLSIRVAKGVDPEVVATTRIPLGAGIAGSVAQSGVPLVVQDIRELPLWQETVAHDQRSDYEDFSALCVPLAIHGQVQGVMNFNHKQGREPFDHADLEFALLIANQASVALYCSRLHQEYQRKQAMDGDLRSARAIQERFHPSRAPQLDGFEVAARSLMCNQVGGDYYDFLPLGADRVALALGDASGHGLGAALLAADARAALRALLRSGESLEECLYQLNNLLHDDSAEEMYMTLLLGVFDAPRRSFTFATAGHHMPALVRGGTALKAPLMGSNIPLGIRRDLAFAREGAVELDPGDVMVLFTDGLWEAADRAGRRFGTDVLPATLERLHTRRAPDILQGILAAVARHRAEPEPEDDCTVVVVKAET
ncbi:MAG TPA: GAF domain-containing SpoIIE family protein phosphatase [Thermoanaerobaculia bacterium]|nr:GAF domain-containing SpoIIE family protein phosphatase [Thermoanaerobaculia bacterium]